MELRHLKLIKEVAEKGSLTKAMDSLFLSQSALSHQLKEVENHLGTQLFHRVNKKLILTGAGKIVLESAKKILRELDKTEQAVKKLINGETGSVRVATECYTCYHWLPSLMIEFNKEFPSVDIEIFPGTTDDPASLILEGELDLAVTTETSETNGLIYTELFRDEMMAVVPIDHPWASKKYVVAEDFRDQNIFIHSFPLDSVTLFNQVLIPAGVSPKKVMPIHVIDAVLQMIKARLGIQVMAQWMVKPYLVENGLTLVPVTKKRLYLTWYAAYIDQPESARHLDNFISHLRCNVGGVCNQALSPTNMNFALN